MRSMNAVLLDMRPKRTAHVRVATAILPINKLLYLYLYLNWQNVLGTHHASAHGGSSDLIVKMLD